MAEIKINFKIKKHFYFWPVYAYFKIMVRLGRVDSKQASDFLVDRCMTFSPQNKM